MRIVLSVAITEMVNKTSSTGNGTHNEDVCPIPDNQDPSQMVLLFI